MLFSVLTSNMEFLSTNNSIITLSSFYIIVVAFAAILNSIVALTSCDFPAIFNFGDSNSDTGEMPSAFISPNPPYGETYFHMPAGRYSDGRVIIDFIAESLNLPSVSAYLNSMGTNFTHGANFAAGGATIRLPSSVIPNGISSPFFLEVQFLQFLQFKLKSEIIRKQGGVFAKLMPKEEYFSKGLYILDIGHNDIGDALLTNMSIEQVNASVADIVNQFSANIQNMHKSGGRWFWIHNTGPLGCLAYMLANFGGEKDEAGCLILLNRVVEYLNFKLKESILQLRIDLPFASFVYVDVYSVKYSLFAAPNKYGFEHPLVACCGYGGMYNFNNTAQCGDKITVNGTQIVVGSCDQPSTRVIWDGIHYTEAANRFVFNQISTGAFSDPPLPLNMSCHHSTN